MFGRVPLLVLFEALDVDDGVLLDRLVVEPPVEPLEPLEALVLGEPDEPDDDAAFATTTTVPFMNGWSEQM